MIIPYWYRNSHIAACFLGLIPLLLFFSGHIGMWWPVGVAGAYYFGWRIGERWNDPEINSSQDSGLPLASLTESLDKTLQAAQYGISKEARSIFDSIKTCVGELAPRLEASSSNSHELKILERLVRKYLPFTLENYLRLPHAYAISKPLSAGKTANELLIAQLTLLNDHLQKMLADAVAEDARAIVENGRFLEEKFKPFDFFEVK